MKESWIRFAAASVIGLVSIAAHGQPSSGSPVQSGTISGPLIQVEMNSDVDVKKAHAGDVFKTRVWEDVRSGDKIILPQKTILIGHVVSAHPRSKDNPDSTLVVAFDKAVLKDGTELPVRGVVERVELSSMAVAAAGPHSPGYNQGLNPGSTTNIAMPNQTVNEEQKQITPGPTYVRDSSIALQADASGTTTVLSSTTKAEVKLKHFATLDVRVTQIGQ